MKQTTPVCAKSRAGLWVLALGLAAGCNATATPAERSHSPRESAFDVEHYALAIELDPRAQSISGSARVRFSARANRLAEVALDFVDLAVRDVRGEVGEALDFTHEAGVLSVQLPRPLNAGDFGEFTVNYAGAPRRGLYFNDPMDGVATQVFTQGECEDSRGWFPCYDFPNDRATSEVVVTLPSNWTAVAAGELVERRELGDGRALERWRMQTPHPTYLTTLVAGEFVTKTSVWDGIPLSYLADPTLEAHMDARFESTPAVLEFFSHLTGVRYPYPKYSQAAVANFQFGGMENISATTLTDTWLTDARGERDQPAFGLLAHEAAHQWFGNLLTCADWSHIWLNEGWATYAEQLYVEAVSGTAAFEASMALVRESYLAADVGAARRPTIYDRYRDPMDLFVTGHAYPGGASRLHQLRFELGDDAFFAGVRRYFADYRDQSVTTADFQRSLEASSGKNLARFFEQWFSAEGYPEFNVSWTWDGAKGRVEVEVEQTQSASGKTPMVFRTPVEIEISMGATLQAQTLIERVEIDDRKEVFGFNAPTRPRWVLFDPRGWLVARTVQQKNDTEWISIAENCSHPLARREALTALGAMALSTKAGRVRSMYADVLETRLADDESEQVRVAAARALGALAPAHGSVALMGAAGHDASASVRVAALVSLAGFAPDPTLVEFARAQFEAGHSWSTMTAALALEASAAPSSAFESVMQALTLPSPHDVLAAGAVSILALLEDPRVAGKLEQLAFSATASASVREAAVRSLSRHARGNPQLRRRIESLLSDANYRLRSAAIDALAGLQDPQALPALRQSHGTLVDSRQRRAIESILRAPWAAGN